MNVFEDFCEDIKCWRGISFENLAVDLSEWLNFKTWLICMFLGMCDK